MRVLRMDSMPLVINDEGLKWVPYLDRPDTRDNEKKLFWAKIKEMNKANSNQRSDSGDQNRQTSPRNRLTRPNNPLSLSIASIAIRQ